MELIIVLLDMIFGAVSLAQKPERSPWESAGLTMVMLLIALLICGGLYVLTVR